MAYDSDGHRPFGAYAPSPMQSALIAIGHRLPRTWAGRRGASLIRSVLKRWSRHPIDAIRLGSRMRLHPTGNASEKRLMTSPQFFDPLELATLERMLRPGFVFVDIGANAGAYTLFVANRVGRGGTVLAVEPHPVALERLRCNLALNGIEWVRIAPVALSDRDGSVSLFVDGRNIGSSSVAAGSADHAGAAIEVRCRTLLGLLEEERLEDIDAMKVDVEGAEDRILLPFLAEAPRARWPRMLLIEDNRAAWKGDLLATLQRSGYVAVAHTNANLVLGLDGALAEGAGP